MNKKHIDRAGAWLKKNKKRLLRLGLYAGVAGFAALFALFGPPHLIGLTETPEFCGSCHSMRGQHKDWLHSAHRQKRCIDCHLPNDNAVNHYLWKSIDGNKDVFYEFTGLREHDEVRLSPHAKRVLQGNCLRCHGEMVSRIGTDRSCTDCHRRTGHMGQARPVTTEELR